MHLALLWLLLAISYETPDTLVVCPGEFRHALDSWKEHRQKQGHRILVVDPPHRPAELEAIVRAAYLSGRLRYLLLIGDVPGALPDAANHAPLCVPTNYKRATINTRWGSEPTIATDVPYADVDDDGIPDLALGRIPADSKEELAEVLRKILRYEEVADGPWQRRIRVIAGAGGFGAISDAVIEAAGRQVFQRTVPPGFDVQHILAHAVPSESSHAVSIRALVQRQLGEGSLAWIYLGHGLPTELDRVDTANGRQAIFSVDDVPRLQCPPQSPLAVLIACYTGAVDSPVDCLAEELSLAANGPVAAIGATRVTMPYGNTVWGYELLRACFQEQSATLGEMMLAAQRRTLLGASSDPLRESLDSMCRGISPPPVDLAAERREHVLMYHLFGDPLMRLRRGPSEIARAHGIAPALR